MNAFVDIALWVIYLISLYFSIFLLLVYFDKKEFFRQERSLLKPAREPIVSVLVPAYNEKKTIINTLESISNLDYPQEKLEVIIINDGSTDNTERIVAEYIQNRPNFKLISHQNKGKAASMNIALEEIKGEFFACLDADSFVDRFTLRKMLSLYYQKNNPALAIITPAMKVYHPKSLLQKVQWLEYIIIVFIARLLSHLDSLYVAPGPFSLYKTKIIKELGGFDEKNITEDQEIAYRVQEHQYQITQCFDGYVYTTAPKKIRPFYKQRRRWYLGSISCVHKYKNLVANKKYGDFGLMQMIKNILGYFFAIAGIIFAAYIFLGPFLTKIKNLLAIKFNILPYLQHFQFKLTFLNFLSNDFRKGFIVMFIFAVGFFFFYLAHKNADEKVMKMGLIAIIPYFAIYYLLKGIILILSLLEFVKTRKLKW